MSTQQALPPAGVDPEVVEREDKRWTPLRIAIWVVIALIGAVAWSMLAFSRGETIQCNLVRLCCGGDVPDCLPFLREVHRTQNCQAR